jgi:hypothetical protein
MNWISVKDQLPDPKIKVFFANDKGESCIGKLWINKEGKIESSCPCYYGYDCAGDWSEEGLNLFWMAIPEMPK